MVSVEKVFSCVFTTLLLKKIITVPVTVTRKYIIQTCKVSKTFQVFV